MGLSLGEGVVYVCGAREGVRRGRGRTGGVVGACRYAVWEVGFCVCVFLGGRRARCQVRLMWVDADGWHHTPKTQFMVLLQISACVFGWSAEPSSAEQPGLHATRSFRPCKSSLPLHTSCPACRPAHLLFSAVKNTSVLWPGRTFTYSWNEWMMIT